MLSGQESKKFDPDYLSFFHNALLEALNDNTQFASQKTQSLFELYIAEAMSQGLDTSPLNAALDTLKSLCGTSSTQSVTSSTSIQNAIANMVRGFHLSYMGENTENKTEELSINSITPQPQPPILASWISSFVISLVGKPSAPTANCSLNDIPNDMFISIIALQLPLPALGCITQTSKKFWCLFQPKLDELNYLSCIMKADQQGADNSLMKLKAHDSNNWKYVFKRMPGQEPCGRKWTSVSPLEYAAWIGDMSMVNMLLNHIPTEGLQQALEQLRAVKTDGLEHGPRMAPFYALINAYKHYDTHFNQFNNWDERDDYCVKTIGGLQLKLSCFGLQWFCDDEPFSPVPAFNRAPRRSFILDGKTWDPFHSYLGASFLLYKFSSGWAMPERMVDVRVCAPHVAFETLCQASSDQLDLVITSLEQRIAATNRPQLK